jgi:hypothetical protein
MMNSKKNKVLTNQNGSERLSERRVSDIFSDTTVSFDETTTEGKEKSSKYLSQVSASATIGSTIYGWYK